MIEPKEDSGLHRMTWRRLALLINSRLNRRATLFAGMWRLERCEVTQIDDKGEAPYAFSRGDCQASGSHIEASRGCHEG
jgi:hypothetical protein